jgi:hypothetical protein
VTISASPNLRSGSVFRLPLGDMSRFAPGRPRRRLRRVAVALVALLATGAVVYGGLRADAPLPRRAATPSGTPAPTATPFSSLDLSGLPIARAPFCDAIDQDDVVTALGGPVSRTSNYDSGDRATLATGLTDVAHEYNCGYASANGTQARAWVFAAPVTTSTGRTLAREPTGGSGCRPVADGPRFGTPSAETRCRTASPTGVAVTLRGLFGDAWLSCQLSTPASGPGATGTVRRAEQWCVRLATTLGARP